VVALVATDARLARSALAERFERHISRATRVTGARTGRLIVLPVLPRRYRVFAAQRLAQFAMASGGGPFLSGLLSKLQAGPYEFRELAFRTHLSMGDIDQADVAAALPGDGLWESPDNQRRLLAQRLLASGDADRALGIVAPTNGEPSLSPQLLVAALRATGRPADVLAAVETHRADLDATDDAIARFDAYWQLGDAERAREAVDDLAGGQLGSVELISRLRSAYVATGSTAEHAAERVLEIADTQPCRTEVDWQVALDFSFNRVDEILSQAASPQFEARLHPRGRYTLAAAAYVRRDFETSRRQLRTLLGTAHHWDAEKLDARMMLEEGRFIEACENRSVRSRLRPALDEVEYFARLHLGQHRRAARMYLARHDANRLRTTFGDAADFLPIDGVPTRFVIAQDGPGDEISMSATYGQLLAVSERVIATCDPRLTSLLQRSFPDVEFVPTYRQPSRPALGFLAPERPPRATGNMYDLLSAEAALLASGADRVVLGRSLIRLTPDAAPYEPYVRPDPLLVEHFRSEQFTVGVVWRSEYVDPMRSIHFVEPTDLAPLADLDADIVCLQHDATPAERSALFHTFGDRVRFMDDLDLRDDFETIAAVTGACSAVVGVGTTTTELAAAVGTRTIYLHPNLIGAWRRIDDDGDYWHQSMRAAVADDYRSPGTSVRHAVRLLRAMNPSGR
jgi:hypothetical protein